MSNHEMNQIAGASRAPARAIKLADVQCWAGVGLMLLLSALTMLSTLRTEFGPWRAEVFGVDEQYFATCATRGLAVGEVPSSGCHDNKAPMIFWVHQAVQTLGAPFSAVDIKLAAVAVVAGLLVLLARIVHPVGGALGAAAAVALALQFWAANSGFMALKTETVGMAFVLASLACLVPRAPTLPVAGLSGLLLGLAVLTKQTHLLLLPLLLVWLLVLHRQGDLPRARAIALVLCLGLVAPLVLVAGYFAIQGRLGAFLSSALLYPSVYGQASDRSIGYTLIWRTGLLLQQLAQMPALPLLFVLSLARPAAASTGTGALPWRQHGLRLLQWATLAQMVVVVIAPHVFDYHAVPAKILMSAVGGIAVADLVRRIGASAPGDLVRLNSALLASTLLMAAVAWSGNGGRGRGQPPQKTNFQVNDQGHAFGYVLGMWPEFYFANRLTPASDVMFPWAIRGTPGNHLYTLPPAGSVQASVLDAARARGVRDLLADLHRNPPAFIALVSDMARAPASANTTDVPEMAAYLQAHCSHLLRHDVRGTQFADIFDCRAPPARTGPR